MVTRSIVLGGTALTLAACTPDFSDTTAVVTAPRLLAVRSTPAEGPTSSGFAMTSLYVGPDGGADASSLSWATCLLQKPLGDPGSVNPECLTVGSTGVVSLGLGASIKGSVPANACELFGPESPPPLAGQPSARPTDPDSTGGYYLPIRVETSDARDSIAFQRILCQPSGVVESVFTAYSANYVPNENPVARSLTLLAGDAGTTLIAPDSPGVQPSVTVRAGTSVSLRVAWPSCPTQPAACGGAETYLLIDTATKELTTARESMVTSWYATAGTFALDRVGRSTDDPSTTVDNAWTAPTTAGPLHLWVVLRDARGGTGWASYTVTVGP